MIAPLHKDESPIRRHLTCGAQAQWYSTARRRLQLQIMVSDALLIRRVSQKKVGKTEAPLFHLHYHESRDTVKKIIQTSPKTGADHKHDVRWRKGAEGCSTEATSHVTGHYCAFLPRRLTT